MHLILEYFKGFEVEYDRMHKIITINKPMPVSDFIILRYLLTKTIEQVEDIRLYADKSTEVMSRR